MLFGKWKIETIVENNHDVTKQYVSANSRYLILQETGIYKVGVIDSSTTKTWVIEEEQNQLILLNGGLFEDLKKWEVIAADNQLKLKFRERAIVITLSRIDQLPEPDFRQANDLLGKWIVDKVTINGLNSTANYAYIDRWIILAKNGRFYNGQKSGNQNSGFWKTNDELTRIEFRVNQDSETPALNFTIGENRIWYEKEQKENKKHSVKIYFKKEDS